MKKFVSILLVSSTLFAQKIDLSTQVKGLLPPLNGGNPQQFSSYTAIGDSIAAGYNASPSTQNYVNLLGTSIGVTPSNIAVPGTGTADQLDQVYSVTPSLSAHQLITWSTNTNDVPAEVNIAGNEVYYRASIQAMMQSGIAWLGTPASHFTMQAAIASGRCVTGNTGGGSGHWSNSSKYGGSMGVVSSTVNDYIDCGDINGYVGYIAPIMGESGSPGSYSIAWDGGSPVTLSTWGAYGQTWSHTQFNRIYGTWLYRVPLNSNTVHDHHFRILVTNATQPIEVMWAGGVEPADTQLGPKIIVASAITAGIGSGWPGGYAALNAIYAKYSEMMQWNAALLKQDGINVEYANFFDAVWIANIDTDQTHPLNAGHVQMFGAMRAKVDNFSGQTIPGFVGSRFPYTQQSAGIYNSYRTDIITGSTTVVGDPAYPTSQYPGWNLVLCKYANVGCVTAMSFPFSGGTPSVSTPWPVTSGGTGANTTSSARLNLGLGSAATVNSAGSCNLVSTDPSGNLLCVNSGFTGTRTAGACVLTMVNGIITGVTGC